MEEPEQPRSELSAQKRAELSRLRATMGFIPRENAPSRIIDERYALERRIGSGGMGVVYVARDLAFEGSRVALKLVRAKILRELPKASLALRREAQRMVELRTDPHVVSVYDVGKTDGSTYLTMEYVEGQDLRKWLRARERSPQDILRAYLDAARGLAAAHAIGVVHCDFKPDNVLIDKRGRAKVSDFGIATLIDDHVVTELDRESREHATSSPTHAQTRLSTRGGTMAYIAPERLSGKRGDPHADQFSFCVALWEGLTGGLPYRWHDLDSQREALAQAPANARRIPQAPVGLSLRRCLIRGLASQREDRNPDMGMIIAAIEWTLGWPKLVRRTTAIGLGLATALAVGIGIHSMLTPSTCDPFVRSIDAHWNEQRRTALLERGEALGVDTQWAADELDALALQWSASARNACGGEQEPPLADPTRRCLERWTGPYAGAIELLTERGDRKTLALAPELFAGLLPVGGDFCTSASFVPEDIELGRLGFEARAAAEAGEEELAQVLGEETIARAASLSEGERFSVHWAHAYAARAEVSRHRGEIELALAQFDKAQAHAIAVEDPTAQLHLQVRRAWTLAHDHNEESVELGMAQLDALEPLYHASETPPDALIRVEALEASALLRRRLGEYETSAEEFERAAQRYGELKNWVFAARSHIGAANLAFERGRHDECESQLQRALALLDREGLPDSYRQMKLYIHYNLALARYQDSVDADEAAAAKAVDEALELLDMVAALARPLLQRKALVYSCTFRAYTKRTEGLGDRIDRAEAALQATESILSSERDNLHVQLLLAALVGLGDRDAEQELRALAVDEQLELDLRVEIMWSLLDELRMQARCQDLTQLLAQAAANKQLMTRSDFSDWVREHPAPECN